VTIGSQVGLNTGGEAQVEEGMNSQSIAQASLVPDGNRHSGRYLLKWW